MSEIRDAYTTVQNERAELLMERQDCLKALEGLYAAVGRAALAAGTGWEIARFQAACAAAQIKIDAIAELTKRIAGLPQ